MFALKQEKINSLVARLPDLLQIYTYVYVYIYVYTRGRVQKFPALHTKAAPNGKCCEGYTVPSMVRLMYQLKSVLK